MPIYLYLDDPAKNVVRAKVIVLAHQRLALLREEVSWAADVKRQEVPLRSREEHGDLPDGKPGRM